MTEENAERTEKPTQQRREKARREGQVPHSSEVGVAVASLTLSVAIASILPWTGSLHIERTKTLLSPSLDGPLTTEHALEAVSEMVWEAGLIVGPVALLALVLGVLTSVAQIGAYVNWENAGPKWQRLDPRNWLKRVFSVELPVSLLKSTFKGIGVVLVALAGVWELPEELWRLAGVPAGALATRLQEVALEVTYRVSAALIALALFDIFWTRYRHEQKLMMSRQEIRDELKDSEGNPHVRGAMRRRMKEVANKRLRDLVSEATVVTTNPSHYAVALRYWRGKDVSPVVVAKGVDHRARRIKAYALELGIPVVEDKPLARTLHALVQEGQNVPVELYRSVARLLAIVYRRRGYLVGGNKS